MSTNGTTTKRSQKEALGPYGRVGQAVGPGFWERTNQGNQTA